jgi:hypothetical protein
MSEHEHTGRLTNRRNVIKTLGASVSLAGVGLSSGARSTPDGEEYVGLAEERRDEDWDIDTWRRRLADAGFDVRHSDKSLGDGEVGTMKLDKHESKLYVTYSEGSSTNWVNFKWSLNDGYDDWATDPLDYAAISFDSSDYERDSYYGPVYGDHVHPIVDREDDTNDTGVVVEYNSNEHAFETVGRFESSFDIAVEPESGTSQREREVHVNYWHSWGAGLKDISIQDENVSLDFDVGLHGGVWNRSASPTESQMDDDGYSDT